MNAITKTSKKERILFNNPKATRLYREAITELIAEVKPEVVIQVLQNIWISTIYGTH